MATGPREGREEGMMVVVMVEIIYSALPMGWALGFGPH